MNRNLILLIGALVLIVAVFAFSRMMTQKTATSGVNTQESPIPTVKESGNEVSVALSEQNNSGESGIATLKEDNGKIVVTLKMTGAPDDTDQPAHIHTGSCAVLGGIRYPLSNVVKGESETAVEVSMDQLKKGLPLAINVHKSAAEVNTYVSCGDVMFK